MGLASVGLADKKVLVYALPAELQGKVVEGATVDIEANLLPITPGDVPGVDLLFSAVETAVDVFAAAVALTGTDISGVHDAIEDLKGLKDLGSYTVTLPATVSDNGEALYVDFTQGLGTYVNQAYATLFQGLETAVNGIDSSIPIVEAALNIFKQATNPLFDLIYSIGNATSDVLNSSINGNILGNITGTLNMTVTQPDEPQATVRAAAVDNALISGDIVSLVQNGGEAVTLNFPVADSTNPLEDYTVPTATLDPVSHGDTTISGSIALDGTEPEGTSFETVVTLPNGDQVRTPIDADGQFTVDTGNLSEGDTISIQVVATNGEHSASSESVNITVLPALEEPDFPDNNEDLNPDEADQNPVIPDISEDSQQNDDHSNDDTITLPKH